MEGCRENYRLRLDPSKNTANTTSPQLPKSSLFGIGSDKLREEFLQFIPKSESGILSNAIGDMEKADMYELLEILSTHDCKVKITKDNIGPVIDQIAHLEMVQEPAFIRECLFEVLITYDYDTSN